VILPWLDRARTVLWAWFPGQEMGTALAAILAGDLEPAGRLPWTLPAAEADSPAPGIRPIEGTLDYAESIHVGYRAWERLGTAPAAPFGHGLGWTDWSYDSVDEPRWTREGDLSVDVMLSNTGARDGIETVQLYLEPPRDAAIERPVRWLAGFATAELAAGESRRVTVVVPRRSFEAWDSHSHHWTRVTGSYAVRIGRSLRDLRLDTVVQAVPDERSASPLPTSQLGDTA
jgi:beta-glucosidase